MSEQIESLKRKRSWLKKRVTDFNKYIDSTLEAAKKAGSRLDRQTLIQLERRLNRLEPVLDEFQAIQDNLNELLGSEGHAETETFENSYFSSVSRAQHVIEDNVASETSPANYVTAASHNSTNTNINSNNIKLPTIKLPKFSGQYTQWLEFRDTFDALIHKAEGLSNIQRFYYLKSSLDGDAAKVIASIETSADNYEIVWSLLCERFENLKLLVYNHIRALFKIPNVSKDSPVHIREMQNAVNHHLRALSGLQQPVEHWDAIIIFIITTKFDQTTAREWEAIGVSKELPTLDDMRAFLSKKAEMLETLNYSRFNLGDIQKPQPKVHSKALIRTKFQCYYCGKSHSIYGCSEFQALSVEDRKRAVQKKALCPNCLRTGHQVKDCISGGCKRCQEKHNSLLHGSSQPRVEGGERPATALIANHAVYGILSTANVYVKDSYNTCRRIQCRAVLDTDSQVNLITLASARKVAAHITPLSESISGLGSCAANVLGQCQLSIKSKISDFSVQLTFFMLQHIIDRVPPVHIPKVQIPQKLQLADPDYQNSRNVDMLIGNGVFWSLISEGKHDLLINEVTLQNTVFGYIFAGPLISATAGSIIKPGCNIARDSDIQKQLAVFWEIEELPSRKILSEDEKAYEDHFLSHHRRDENGRFIVSIPMKLHAQALGNSKEIALKRFYNLERKLHANLQFMNKYVEFMREYEKLGHMTRADDKIPNDFGYYSPHYGVINEASTTTKLRVVFDASCPKSTGYSFNSLQLVGPTIQSDLLSILLRFRQHAIAISADITKMYRQVLIEPEQRNLQRILWRDNPSRPVSVYELNTVTYGTASASFLAIRCLHQLASENMSLSPNASRIITTDFYVEDLLTGSDDVNEAATLSRQISNILSRGGFPLRKWLSNNPRALVKIAKSGESLNLLPLGEHENTKTLGVHWAPREDDLLFKVNDNIPGESTKRRILSTISQIFDPLGLIGACTILAKITLQQLWLQNLDWDDVIPEHIQSDWSRFCNNLKYLNELRIPRHVLCKKPTTIQLHRFSACVYILSKVTRGKASVHLVASKAKVATLKTLTIPRLDPRWPTKRS